MIQVLRSNLCKTSQNFRHWKHQKQFSISTLSKISNKIFPFYGCLNISSITNLFAKFSVWCTSMKLPSYENRVQLKDAVVMYYHTYSRVKDTSNLTIPRTSKMVTTETIKACELYRPTWQQKFGTITSSTSNVLNCMNNKSEEISILICL